MVVEAVLPEEDGEEEVGGLATRKEGGGEEVSIVSVVAPHTLLGLLSLGSFCLLVLLQSGLLTILCSLPLETALLLGSLIRIRRS